jgi:hypothetical protein
MKRTLSFNQLTIGDEFTFARVEGLQVEEGRYRKVSARRAQRIDLTNEVPPFAVQAQRFVVVTVPDPTPDEIDTDTAFHHSLLGDDLEGPWPEEILEDLRIRARQLKLPESFIVR